MVNRIRTIKRSFSYIGDNLVEEKYKHYLAAKSYTVQYLYDEENKAYGLIYNGKKYFFIRDALLNILGIVDYNGDLVVKYTYDAFGNILSIGGTLASTLGKYNHIRYKGYYYLEELDMYYLQSRLYDPSIGRFISPDSVDYLEPTSINGLNLYSYCGNDPVNKYDPSGHFPFLVFIWGVAIGMLIGFGIAAYCDYSDDKKVNGSVGLETYITSVASCGILGGLIGIGFGLIGSGVALGISTSGSAMTLSSIGSISVAGAITNAEVLVAAGIISGINIMLSNKLKSGGYSVKVYPNDHQPPHCHIYGDDIVDKTHGIRVGLDGNSLSGEQKLTSRMKKALQKIWKEILKEMTKKGYKI